MNICLNMCVLNEAAVIRRCLDAVRPWVTSWVIVDTGSTDGTQEAIRQAMAGLPGELHERPDLKGQQQQYRNEALRLARAFGCDYTLTLDADEVFFAPDGFEWPELGADSHDLVVRWGELEWGHPRLLRAAKPWRWVGDADPYLHVDAAVTGPAVADARVIGTSNGVSYSDPDKWKKKAARLEAMVAKEPTPRWTYYWAQALKCAGDFERALEVYLQRSRMSGWVEETWSALYEVGKLRERLQQSPEQITSAHITAWRYRPTRAESLFNVARYLRTRGENVQARAFARIAADIPKPADRLFVESGIYRWRIHDVLAMCEFKTGQWQRAYQAGLRARAGAPAQEHARLDKNLEYYRRQVM